MQMQRPYAHFKQTSNIHSLALSLTHTIHVSELRVIKMTTKFSHADQMQNISPEPRCLIRIMKQTAENPATELLSAFEEWNRLRLQNAPHVNVYFEDDLKLEICK